MRFKCALLAMSVAILSTACSKKDDDNSLDKRNPETITEEEFEKFDREYEAATGKKASLPAGRGTCRNIDCPLFALVDKETQTLTLYVDGEIKEVWDVSTGTYGHETPGFSKNPNGRIYDEYMSKTYPGGDYEGLGNMPYAVFIEGGFAIHGTGRSNWKKLGSRASHGCIRVHPDNAFTFNRLVRKYGVANTWITVQ